MLYIPPLPSTSTDDTGTGTVTACARLDISADLLNIDSATKTISAKISRLKSCKVYLFIALHACMLTYTIVSRASAHSRVSAHVTGGREGHSEYGCTSRIPHPAFWKTGSRDRYTLVSGFCNNGLRSPGLIVGAAAGLRIQQHRTPDRMKLKSRTPDCRTYESNDNGRGLVLSCDGGPRSSQMFIYSS